MSNADRWVANVMIVVVVAAFGWWSHTESSKAEVALCALRADLEVRVHNSEKYLADVNDGRREPIQGITSRDIKDSIKNQRRTIHALRGLDCK